MTTMIPSLRLLLGGVLLVLTTLPPASADAPAAPATAGPTTVRQVSDETNPGPADVKHNPAEESYWKALRLFRSKENADQAAGRAALEKAAAGEFTHAQLLLGECYQSGSYGFPKNDRKAAVQFRLAAERGNAFAQVSFGLCLFAGIGVWKDEAKAANWLNAALAANADYSQPTPPADFFDPVANQKPEEPAIAGVAFEDPVGSAQARAHYFLGVLLDGQKKPAEAQNHYVAAATAGVAGRSGVQQAAVQAAVNFAFGKGVPRDMQKANEMLEQSKKLGSRKGISLLHNFAAARLVDDFAVSDLEENIAKSTDQMATNLQFVIGVQLTDRKSKDYNPQEAVKWFELAAVSGQPWAMLELGFLYSGNDLGSPDPAKAFTWFERVGGGEHPKHYLGTGNLVICLTNGLGAQQDTARATGLAKRFRDDDLLCYLATIGNCPTSITNFDQELELNQKWAKGQKDAQAQYLLGNRYLNGWGVKADTREAERWFKKAVKMGNGPACRALGYLYESRWWFFGINQSEAWQRAAELYQKGAAAGDAVATANLAYMYENGQGVARNSAMSKELYEKSLAIEPNFPRALNNLGCAYEKLFDDAKTKGNDLVGNAYREEMIECYEKADMGGYPYAADNLGRLYYAGVLGRPDFQKAYSYFEKAAEHGNHDARMKIAGMLEKGEGVPVSYTEAAYHYRLAALDGDRVALRWLVTFYLEGKDGSQDFDRAAFWVQRLALSGDVGALPTIADLAIKQKKYADALRILEALRAEKNPTLSGYAYDRLSRCYREGLGVKVKPERAQAYLELAASLGNGDAMFRIAASKMAEGKEAEALVLFEKAAAKNPAACYALGQMYYSGQHVPTNLTKAIGCLRKAADGKDRDALYFLAAMTANHAEEAPTLEEAIRFAQAAEGLGHPKATELREELEKQRQQEPEKPEETAGARAT